jgi:hypothetical protein
LVAERARVCNLSVRCDDVTAGTEGNEASISDSIPCQHVSCLELIAHVARMGKTRNAYESHVC